MPCRQNLPRRKAAAVAVPVAESASFVSIGEAAQRSGVSAKMVRHYESLGLLASVARQSNGYRQYSERDIHTLRFIKRARDLGFSMAEIAELVGLWLNRRRASVSVKRIAQAHADDLSRRINEMQAMQQALQHLIHCCHGDQRPDCPILEDLAGSKEPTR
jgi:MerR family copper efflux transcriptional regulator